MDPSHNQSASRVNMILMCFFASEIEPSFCWEHDAFSGRCRLKLLPSDCSHVVLAVKLFHKLRCLLAPCLWHESHESGRKKYQWDISSWVFFGVLFYHIQWSQWSRNPSPRIHRDKEKNYIDIYIYIDHRVSTTLTNPSQSTLRWVYVPNLCPPALMKNLRGWRQYLEAFEHDTVESKGIDAMKGREETSAQVPLWPHLWLLHFQCRLMSVHDVNLKTKMNIHYVK